MDIYDRIDAAEADIARLGQDWLNTYVVPYYLNWMSSNVLRDDFTPAPLGWLPDIKQRARELDTATIRTMLNCAWRIQVMGAWYAVAKNDPSLADAVNDSLDICFGHLTAPPLAVAAVRLANDNTIDALRSFRDRHPNSEQSSVDIVTAALAKLEALEPRDRLNPQAVDRLDEMLSVAKFLAAGTNR